MGLMIELDHTGDTPLQWDPSDKRQVEDASAKFADMKARGYAAFGVDKSGKKGVLLHEFDSSQERVIFHPQYQGG